jgi:phosphoglucomutase
VAAANNVAIKVSARSLMSTPAASASIRAGMADCACTFTASHNPGGVLGDFGMKLNLRNGEPANDSISDMIQAECDVLRTYNTFVLLETVDFSCPGRVHVKCVGGEFEVEIVDTIAPYMNTLRSSFDFGKLQDAISAGRLTLLHDGMNAVGGVYTRAIWNELGAPLEWLRRSQPLVDFGGIHPDPNQVHARALLEEFSVNPINSTRLFHAGNAEERVALENADGLTEHSTHPSTICVCTDGDADRNMIVGPGVCVSPSDSLAVIAAHASSIPLFRDGLKAVARSMPTAPAIDKVGHSFQLDRMIKQQCDEGCCESKY